jgi:hypothetical protein
MTGDNLLASESALLVVLMAEAREVLHTELRDTYGFEVRKPSRDKLVRLRYVSSRKSGRTFTLQLEDGGWVRVQKDLEVKARGAAAVGAALTALQTALRDRVLARSGCASLAELFALNDVRGEVSVPGEVRGEVSVPGEVRGEVSVPGDGRGEVSVPGDGRGEVSRTDDLSGGESVPDRDRQLRDRLVATYHALAGEPGGWVGLARLRPFLADLPRDAVDEGLRRLSREAGVNVVPESNQKMLTGADTQAALRLGGQDKHLLAIGV